MLYIIMRLIIILIFCRLQKHVIVTHHRLQNITSLNSPTAELLLNDHCNQVGNLHNMKHFKR